MSDSFIKIYMNKENTKNTGSAKEFEPPVLVFQHTRPVVA